VSTLTIRSDKQVDEALDYLTGFYGQNKSQAAKDAILLAEKVARAKALKAESSALADDPQDRQAVREAAQSLDEYRAW